MTIPTKVLPGFMELLPAEQIAFERVKAIIQSTYEQFGFIPLDTPVIERAEVLFAKAGGETEKQIYRIAKGEDELALRFDLTVPLARYVSEHGRDLAFPFRRYHIGKVYRGERPQKGRYRELYQCDIDIIGNESLSLINDAEIPSIIYSVFTKLDIGPFIIRINNRKLITGLLESLGISNLAVEIMRIVDKLEKVGRGSVEEMLAAAGVPKDAVSKIFKFLDIKGTTTEMIKELRAFGINNETFEKGISELSTVVGYLGQLKVSEENYVIDLSISRGLDYYTGTVYETKLVNYPEIGSICSGGRYDNLTSEYSSKKLPGVGISIGLTRLFYQLLEAGLIKTERATTAKVLVIPLVDDMTVPLEIASSLRVAGINTEVYLEDAKMKSKLAYADKIGVPYTLLIGEDEIKSGKFTLKNMLTGEQTSVTAQEIASKI